MSTLERRSLEAWIDRARRQEGSPADLKEGPACLPAHVGLWLDRCLFEPQLDEKEGEKPGRQALYQAAIDALRLSDRPPPAVDGYKPRFERWRRWATSMEPGVTRWTATIAATSRVLLHPAAGSTVTDGSLLLHHSYGVPYLPGSALKGVARRHAQQMGAPEDRLTALFGLEREDGAGDGEQGEAGILDICDALWVPERPASDQGDFSPLAFDIVNPHHGAYYTTAGNRPFPLERDEPVPTHLLTLRPGTRFLIVIEAPALGGGIEREWLEWVGDKVLLAALAETGIGARTTAGYGRFEPIDRPVAPRLSGPEAAAAPVRRQEAAKVSYQKGSRELRAQLADGRVATARGDAADALLASIPEGALAKLRKGKDVEFLAEWEPLGRERRLVGIKSAER